MAANLEANTKSMDNLIALVTKRWVYEMEKSLKIILSLIITSVFITGCYNFGYLPNPELEKEKPIPVITTTIYSGGFST